MTPEISSSIILTLVGMGVVFGFLIVMIFVVDFSSRFLSRYAHLIEKPQEKKPAAAKSDNGEVIAAIAMALQNR